MLRLKYKEVGQSANSLQQYGEPPNTRADVFFFFSYLFGLTFFLFCGLSYVIHFTGGSNLEKALISQTKFYNSFSFLFFRKLILKSYVFSWIDNGFINFFFFLSVGMIIELSHINNKCSQSINESCEQRQRAHRTVLTSLVTFLQMFCIVVLF